MGSSRLVDYKSSGGKLLRLRLTEENGRIRSVQISGDFFLLPEDSLPRLEEMLEGVGLREAEVRTQVERFYETSRVQSLGVSSDDIVRALIQRKRMYQCLD